MSTSILRVSPRLATVITTVLYILRFGWFVWNKAANSTLLNRTLAGTEHDQAGRFQWPRGLRRSPAGIVGSNPTGGMDVCML